MPPRTAMPVFQGQNTVNQPAPLGAFVAVGTNLLVQEIDDDGFIFENDSGVILLEI